MPRSRRDSAAWPQPAVAWELLPPPQPELLTFPTGKDAKAQVEPGQSVKIGQLLVQGALPVYSPVSGTVLDADSTLVCVKNDYEDTALPCAPNPVLDELSNEQIFAAIEHSGAASACGIPTSHTLRGLSSAPKQIVISCLDGSCLGMSQAFTMYHRGEQVLGGLRILMRLLGAPGGTILVPADQKPLLDKVLRLLPADNTITMRAVRPRYPAPPAASLLKQCRQTPDTALLLSAQEAAAIYDSVYFSTPVLKQMLTLATPDRLYCMYVMLGTPLVQVLSQANLLESATAIAAGDGLTGKLLTDLCFPIQSAVSQFTLFSTPPSAPSPLCIHCGRCATVCPANLRPDRVYSHLGRPASARFLARTASRCLQCGLCQYHCPAKLPLLQALQQIRTQQDVQEVLQHG